MEVTSEQRPEESKGTDCTNICDREFQLEENTLVRSLIGLSKGVQEIGRSNGVREYEQIKGEEDGIKKLGRDEIK